VDPVDVAYMLSNSLPNVISTEFNPNGSERQILASLEDLVDSIRKAVPIRIKISKEDWLASRATQKARAVATKEHGAREPESVSAAAAGEAPLEEVVSSPAPRADVPASVPELPQAYLVRNEDLAQLKQALLSGGGASNSTALTSQVASGQQKRQNKVGAHGMGGVGKTTIAVALVNDEEVRARFDKIVWVSLGQSPDLRDLASSIHFQLTDQHFPETIKRDDEALKALQTAAKGKNVLLVLDDCWDAKHEKPLNCIDPDNFSRLLVTTRIRNLLKHSAEVDVGILSSADALKLLLSSAEMGEEDVEEGSEEHRVATEIVELCGRLPLTLSIAGGMISDNPDGFTDDVLDLMREDRLRDQEDEDDSGFTVEERVIECSLKMVKGKNKDLVLSVFKFFSVFPEDIAVPAGLFNILAPTLIPGEKNPKKAKLTLGSCLSTLLKYNLVKGSLGAGQQGVFMHDIVRDYVISQHSAKELQELHRVVLSTIFAARPDAGFSAPENAVHAHGTLDKYICLHMHVHFRGALTDEEEAPDAWLTDADTVVLQNVAVALGFDALMVLANAREQAGELVGAAHALFVSFWTKNIDVQAASDVLERAADLLERADDKNVIEFEKKVLDIVWGRTLGHDINYKFTERMKALAPEQELTWESKLAETTQFASSIFVALGLFGGDVDENSKTEALQTSIKVISLYKEVAAFPDCPESIRNWGDNLQGPFFFGCMGIGAAHLPEYESFISSCNETKVSAAVDFYSRSVCGVAFIEKWGFDPFQFGYLSVAPALIWGNIDLLERLEGKFLTTFEELNLPVTKKYPQYMFEIYDNTNGAAGTSLILERCEQAYSLFKSMGFAGWDKDSIDNISTLLTAFQGIFVGIDTEKDMVWFKLAIFLAAPQGLIDESEVNAWMPSPSSLAEMEKDYAWFKRYSVHDVTATGAKVFMRLGRDDEAYELAKLTVAPEQRTEKKPTLVQAYVILGKIAAKRGDVDEAEVHFAKALKESQLALMPVLGVMTARDWKKHLLQPNGRDCSAAEATIDAACAKMGKTREQLIGILV
jgi:hypothetical protein